MSPYERSISPDRKAWRESQPDKCMVCRSSDVVLEVHEIAKRSSAPKTWGNRLNYLLLCQSCHREVEASREVWPLARQLALKLVRDPKHFDLKSWLALYYPNAPERVTWAEVAEYLEVKL